MSAAASRIRLNVPWRLMSMTRSHSAGGVGIFDQQGDARATTDAGRGDTEPAARAPELARERDREPHAGRPERMADGDGAAVDVELCLVDADLARASDHLGAERLVDLE